jgi:hypothetical protein
MPGLCHYALRYPGQSTTAKRPASTASTIEGRGSGFGASSPDRSIAYLQPGPWEMSRASAPAHLRGLLGRVAHVSGSHSRATIDSAAASCSSASDSSARWASRIEPGPQTSTGIPSARA